MRLEWIKLRVIALKIVEVRLEGTARSASKLFVDCLAGLGKPKCGNSGLNLKVFCECAASLIEVRTISKRPRHWRFGKLSVKSTKWMGHNSGSKSEKLGKSKHTFLARIKGMLADLINMEEISNRKSKARVVVENTN